MTPGLDKIDDRTPEQAREHIASRDRQAWFRGQHASGDYGIISGRDGREVARCHKPEDRDAIITLARSHDALVAALEAVTDELERIATPEACVGKVRHQAHAALVLARGATPLKTADELAATPGGIR